MLIHDNTKQIFDDTKESIQEDFHPYPLNNSKSISLLKIENRL
jgi:hypothetical protein